MKIKLLLVFSILCFHLSHAQETIDVRGQVFSSADHTPLAGVNIIVKGTTNGTTSDRDGNFSIRVNGKDILVFSFIGFSQQLLQVDDDSPLEIILKEDLTTLGEITIVSTGYQELSKERSNASFAHLDNQLVNRRVSSDVLSRLEDVTSGVIFNTNIDGRENDISIRGTSSINSRTQPLIVIDNFPYDGDISTLNPNDVESITVLKDAAAASIWGARAGNGVIVITTKKGGFSQPVEVSFNSNVTIAGKPDVFYVPRMSSADILDNERMLFEDGYYASAESFPSSPLTPGVEAMNARRDGLISETELQSRLSSLASHDVRNDYERYFYRTAVTQQYALNVSGGSLHHRYFISSGWDKASENLVGNQSDRVTLNFNNSWTALKERLTIGAGIYYARSQAQANNQGPGSILYKSSYPTYGYAKLKDENGNNLPVIGDYKQSFIDDALSNGLLDWNYVPLDEVDNRSNITTLTDYRINSSLNYKILEGLNAEVLYQYWGNTSDQSDIYKKDSYFARNLINEYTNVDAFGNITRPVPVGAIADLSNNMSEGHSFRGQLNFNRVFEEHSLSALAGYEVREITTEGTSFRNYGYDESIATVQPVDYINYFDQYDYPGWFTQIPFVNQKISLTDRFISYYANGGYTYKGRYSISGSARRDQSNLFGVDANQRGVPLWSAGLGWTISEEAFYKFSWLPYVKLRATYGYNGNINKQSTAYTTAYNLGINFLNGLPYAVITNPPNPDLRWERVKIYNAGLDFDSKNHRLSGSLDYFAKRGIDLIGSSPFPPSTGVTTFTGNNASTKSYGIDFVLNSINTNGALKWNTTLLLSTLKEEVTGYETQTQSLDLLFNGSGSTGTPAPLKGKPLYAIYSYAWAGLDPETGDPLSIVDGTASTDYSTIVSSATPETLVYHGPARPTTYGALRNTVSWKNMSLSFNISYRLGYYFRNKSVVYGDVLSGITSHGDYGARWQEAGDELRTHVPSRPSTFDFNRDYVYGYSEVLVEKGDNIRLQDISLSYALTRNEFKKMPLSRIEFYLYLNNVGILWKASSSDVDPDYLLAKPVRTIAFGIRGNF